MLEWIDEWGARLTMFAFVYSLVAMMVVWGYVSVGLQPPPLLPSSLMDIYARAVSAWASVSGALVSGDIVSVVLSLFEALANTMSVLLALLASVAISYVWIAVLVARSLPPPLNIMTPMVWAAGAIANTIVAIYMLKKTMELVSQVRSMLPI